MTLQTISHCRQMWLIGIEGRSLDGLDTGCGLPGAIAVSAPDLARAPRAPQRAPCPRCGKLVVVTTTHSQSKEIL